MAILRWLFKNLGSMILAFVLALLVWAAAVNESDPLITQQFPGAVTIEYTNIEEGFVIVGDAPREGTITLRAPSSVWEQLTGTELRLVVDLDGLQDGSYTLDVAPEVDVGMVRVISYEPTIVDLTLEPSSSLQMRVNVVLSGEPAIGYGYEDPIATPNRATVEGPSSLVQEIEALQAIVNIAGRNSDLSTSAAIIPVDSTGNVVEGVSVSPATTIVQVSFVQQSGYRYVAVVPIIEGGPASGYWIRNITYTPTAVTLQALDPQAVELLPGYVETEPIVLTDARETIERTVMLSLPAGFTVIGDPRITVVVTIEALETSITVTLPLEIIGLEVGMAAQISPETVSVFLQGPQPTLEDLQPEDVIVVLDLTGLGIGVHQIAPEVRTFLDDVEVQAVLPETVEVTITRLVTPTPGS